MKKRITLKPLYAKISLSSKKIALLLLPIFFIASSVAFAQAPLISMQNGSIVYNKYANEGETAMVNQIPDFSGVGYRGGGVAIPTLPVKKTIQPVQGDCLELIQAAIDEVSALPLDANGFRGAVLLKAGVYPVEGSLFIKASGVVLRGEGDGVTGTVIVATKKAQHYLINIEGTTTGGEVAGTRTRVSPAYVPVGAKTFSVVTNNFQVGDEVIVRKTPTQNWIDRINMAQYGWTISGYTRSFQNKVVAINGNNITLDMPIIDPIDEAYGGADVFKTNLVRTVKECGIENMRIESIYASEEDESHGWFAINTVRAENCWIKGVISKYFGNGAVNISTSSKFITVEDCVMADPKSITTGGRKYSFNIEFGATAILFQRCMSWGGRHDFVTGGTVPGPNVFLDCVTQNANTESGPHHRYSTGQLYDNLYGQSFGVYNRGASGTGHGWSGAQILFYNCESTRSNITVSSPAGAKNWGIGCKGPGQVGNGYWESWGTNVLPRSLYLQQLQERLGLAAVQNIATTQQLNDAVAMRNAMVTRVNAIKAEERVTYVGMDDLEDSFLDVTDNGGILTSQYSNNPSRPWENYPSSTDNLKSTKYYQPGQTNLWVQYQSSAPVAVVKYNIVSAHDAADRDPKNWELLGSNDGATWTILDTRSGELFATRMLTRSFNITNTTPYLYYRLKITAVNGSTGTQFAEWQLFEKQAQKITFEDLFKTINDEPFSVPVSTNSGLPLDLQLVSGPATLNSGILTITGAGRVILRASQTGTDQYFPASVDYSFDVQASYLVATANSATQITLSWNDNSNDGSVFQLQQSTNGTSFMDIDIPSTSANGVTTYVVSGLTANTRYWFRIEAENSSGKTYSNIDDALTSQSPNTLYKIKVVANQSFSLHAASATPVNGTNVDVYNGNYPATQEWQFLDTDNGFKRIVSKTNPSLVLECAALPADGINVRLGTWTGSIRQQWLLTDVGNGIYKITARENDAMALECVATSNSSNVRVMNYLGNTRQQWTLESVGAVLPVSLTTFSAHKETTGVKLRWNTVSEQDNSHFEVQSSSNGLSFSTIGKVYGAGNSNVSLNYSFTDKNAVSGINYYRLTQIDFDGKATLSKVVFANMGFNNSSLQIFSPVNSTNLNIRIVAEEASAGALVIYNMGGQKIFAKTIVVNKGNNDLTVELSNAVNGIFVATYDNGVQILKKKFIK